MADFAVWGEAILQSWGYQEGKFLKVYYDNMGRQNAEVIDSNPVAFAIRKLVEEWSRSLSPSSSNIVFDGTPTTFLDELNRISALHRINTYSREWPKDVKWLVRRINIVKSNVHKALDIKIKISRDSRDNTSKILLMKNISVNSEKNNLSPDFRNLTPYFDDLSPDTSQHLNEKLNNSGDTGYNGDIPNQISLDSANLIQEKDLEDISSQYPENPKKFQDTDINSKDPNILYDSNTQLYSCKQHPNVMNIHHDEIVRHKKLSPDHDYDSSYLNKLGN